MAEKKDGWENGGERTGGRMRENGREDGRMAAAQKPIHPCGA